MKILKRTLAAVAILGFLLIVASNFLPSTFSVTRSREIPDNSEKIYAIISNLETWENWATFSVPVEEDVEVAYSEKHAGKGAFKKWTQEREGRTWDKTIVEKIGWIEIRNAKPPSELKFEYSMDKGKHIVEGKVTLAPIGEKTKVTWTFTGRFRKQPMEKYVGIWVEDLLGKRINETLASLESYCLKK